MTVDNYYKIKVMLEKKLLEELNRYKSINNYNYGKRIISEQDVPPAPVGDIPAAPGGDVPPPPGGDIPPAPVGDTPPVDTDTTEEIDITDLVNMTKNIKKEIDKNKDEHGNVISKMDDVFTKLNDLETKLSQMDSLLSKIDQLSSKVETMKEPSAVEKLEMRSLDSYPFSQNPQQFFAKKQDEMKASGKNQYVLTKDEVENYSKDEIRKTFNPEDNEFSV